MPSRIALSPAALEFAEDHGDLDRATKAMMQELAQGPRPAEDLIRMVADAQHLDKAVVQKAIIAAVRRGDVLMDQRFTVRVT